MPTICFKRPSANYGRNSILFAQGAISWLGRVKWLEIQHYYRRQARDRRIFSAEFIALIDRRLPEMEGELLQMREAFRNCMAKLRASDRDIVERCYESGTTVAQVAEQVHRPLETIKSILKRSRRALYECVRRTMLTENRESEDRK
jgi:RNA polymerase sigma factor (sigma-70 family)